MSTPGVRPLTEAFAQLTIPSAKDITYIKEESIMAKSSSASGTGASTIVNMLREDHQKVKDLFDEFEDTNDSKEKQRIVETALAELDVHAKLEEDLIYPAIRGEIDEDDLMDEALEEHHVVHVLIAELKKMKPRSERYDAKFTVLGENVQHHIKEEEGDMLPKAEGLDLDWEELTARVMKKKEQLMSKASGQSKNGRSGAAKKGTPRGQARR
ncbi:MAG: hemerythrin domain-containing protein [Nitrospirota bacterium]|nr:hemerythrin domain-containing protein [Nitrospirota bacterium]